MRFFISQEERDIHRQHRPPTLIFGLFHLKLSNYKSMIKTCRNFIVNSNWPLVNKLEEKIFLLPKRMGQKARSPGWLPMGACPRGSFSQFAPTEAGREFPEYARDLGVSSTFPSQLFLWLYLGL